ncbi:ribokinase [Spirochaetia bacterium]|nr:ribokinase [Spirochaetia bacterium]
MNNKYLAAIGSSCIDEYYNLKEVPRLGEKVICTYIESVPGGMIGNAISVFASYGVPAYMIDFMNTGKQMEFLLDDMKHYHVNVDYVSRDEKLPDTKCIIMLKDGERIIFVVNNKKKDLVLSEKQIDLLNGSEFVYTTITELLSLRNYADIIAGFRKSGSRLVLDAEANTISKDDAVLSILRNGDILFINEEGIKRTESYWGGEFITDLAASGAMVVFTLGPRGCKILLKGRDYPALPALDVAVRDTTGAGDTFNASFLYYLSLGRDAGDAAAFATAAAARSIGILGPRSGAVGEQEVLRFIKPFRENPAYKNLQIPE